ncbi:syntaxin binding protein, putative [Eimeria praecox]|uniref:Syntaxin binding protein, putative n=1 Tax=Eimeria praecox TaxID=51316 RepID=U6GLR3_9EIME|nr:syntaxin binding protein, putative [Eimeria praecox]
MASIKGISKRRLLEGMVRRVGGPGNYIAMVVDEKTLNVLSSCCSVYDVLYDGVTIVELISKQRQPLPELNALYFLSPSEDSVQALINDFKDEKKPQYRSAYVYFSSPIPYEQRVFHFGMPNALFELFPLPSRYLLQKVADDLVSLCVTIGQKPAVRYHRNQLPWCEQLATLVHKGLEAEEILPSDHPGTTLLILDRSVDLAPLFIHEYTYQALAYDVLGLPVCCPKPPKKESLDAPVIMEDVYEYDVTNNMGLVERKKAILGEQDEVWVRYRHQHVQEVNQSVQEEVQLFLKENSTAKVQQNMATTSEDTLRAIRSLPQYQEALSRYWTHVTLSEKCFDKLQELKIMAVGAVEQDLCCGVDKDGKEISASKLQAAVGSLVSDDSIQPDEKLRLLLLEFTQILGLDAADRTKAMETAQMSLLNRRCIQRFLELELHAASLSREQASKSKPSHIFEEDREKIRHFKQRAKRARYDLSRRMMGNHDTAQTKRGTAVIGRSTEWTWDSAVPEVVQKPQSSPSILDKSKKGLIVFILGGIVQSEMRCAYEVSKELNCEVFIGGTNILTPSQVLKQLKEQAPVN